MKRLLLLLIILLSGCAAASPIDFLIPSPTMGVTTNYLGHVTPPKMNGIYHSLRDTKNETALLEVRKAELDALYFIAKTGNGLVAETFDPISSALWVGLLGAAGAAGLFVDKPGTKKRIDVAKAEQPDNSPDNA
jgi:hypothetical protein